MVVASFGDQFRLTLLTNDPVLAANADRAGINRVGIDLERLGKAKRQAGQEARLSDHKLEDLAAVALSLRSAELFVRLNPPHPGMSEEIEAVLSGGAQVLMLPYFHRLVEVEQFVNFIGGRATAIVLVETARAVRCLADVLRIGGIGEVMIGLNDLRLELGIRSHFELLASPLLDRMANEVRKAGLPFSFGGVTRPSDHWLPVDPDLVLAQFPRLGATGAWIARSFLRNLEPKRLAEDIHVIRQRLSEWSIVPDEMLRRTRDELRRRATRPDEATPAAEPGGGRLYR